MRKICGVSSSGTSFISVMKAANLWEFYHPAEIGGLNGAMHRSILVRR
jgi:hypothetical protein